MIAFIAANSEDPDEMSVQVQLDKEPSEGMYTQQELLSVFTGPSTVNILKLQTLVAWQKGIDKQCRPRSDFLRSSRIRLQKQSDQGLPCFLF